MAEPISEAGKKRVEALLQKYLDTSQDFRINLSGIVTVDTSGGMNKFTWTSGHAVGKEWTEIFNSLMRDGAL